MVNYNENVYGRRGLDGRSHIPELPFWVALIRIAQFILALIVVILVGYASSVFGASWVPGYGHTFFTFSWTVVFLIYIFVTPLWSPSTYHYYTHLVFESTVAVFWLVTWALLAKESSDYDKIVKYYNELLAIEADFGSNIQNYLPPSWKSAVDCTKAAAGLGALTWVLFVITLFVFTKSVQKHRVANGASGFSFGGFTGKGAATTTTAPADVEAAPVQQEKYTAPSQKPMEMNDLNESHHHETQHHYETQTTQHPVSLPSVA